MGPVKYKEWLISSLTRHLLEETLRISPKAGELVYFIVFWEGEFG